MQCKTQNEKYTQHTHTHSVCDAFQVGISNFKFRNKSYLYAKVLAEMHTVTSCFKSIIATTFTLYSEYIHQEVRMKANKV